MTKCASVSAFVVISVGEDDQGETCPLRLAHSFSRSIGAQSPSITKILECVSGSGDGGSLSGS